MRNDRQTYMSQYSPSGGLARMIFGRLPLARGDTGSEGITHTICYSVRWCGLPAERRGLPTRSRSHPDPDRRTGEPARRPCTIEAGGGSATVYQILRPEKTGLRMTDSLCGDMSHGRPPTGFLESDVGGMPVRECDVGRTLDERVSSELETTRLTDNEVRGGCCFTMDNKRSQTCPELIEGCQN